MYRPGYLASYESFLSSLKPNEGQMTEQHNITTTHTTALINYTIFFPKCDEVPNVTQYVPSSTLHLSSNLEIFQHVLRILIWLQEPGDHI